MLKRHFNLSENGTTLRTEVLAGTNNLRDNGLHHFRSAGGAWRGGNGCRRGVHLDLSDYHCLMMKSVRDIEWDDFTEALPAFLMMVMMPLTFSITDGIAFGFISYALLKLVTGRAKEVHWLIYVFAFLFVVRYAISGLH